MLCPLSYEGKLSCSSELERSTNHQSFLTTPITLLIEPWRSRRSRPLCCDRGQIVYRESHCRRCATVYLLTAPSRVLAKHGQREAAPHHTTLDSETNCLVYCIVRRPESQQEGTEISE